MANYASSRLKKQITEEVALQRLESLCAAGEHCRYELLEKLRKWGVSAAESNRIIDSLEQRKFVDDQRFALSFANDKLRYNYWGRIKISLALRAKHINTQLITRALDEIDAEEYENTVRNMLTLKARNIKEGNCYDGRNRLYRYGISRGFESGIVARIVKSPDTWGADES